MNYVIAVLAAMLCYPFFYHLFDRFYNGKRRNRMLTKIPLLPIWVDWLMGIEWYRKGDTNIYVFPWRRKRFKMDGRKWHSVGFCAYFHTLKDIDDEWEGYRQAMIKKCEERAFREEMSARYDNIEPELYTCYECPEKDICKYVNDPYNLNGDCLASK